MKKYLFFLWGSVVFVCSISAQTQTSVEFEKPDVNDFDFLSDEKFNHDRNAIMLNNVFVKSFIGINLDSVSNSGVVIGIGWPFVVKGVKNHYNTIVVTQNPTDSIVVTQDPHKHPVVINGIEYSRFCNISVDKEIELVTLDEIKEMYFPDAKEPCVFMVNKFFLTNDLQSYKFEKDFILKVELIKSDKFESLKNNSPFSIVRIFTKTRKNLRDLTQIRICC
jgi:hypothetical protein